MLSGYFPPMIKQFMSPPALKTELIFCWTGTKISTPIQNSPNQMMSNSFRHKKRLEVNHYDSIEKIFYYDLSWKRLKQWIVKTKTRIKEKTKFAFFFKPTFLSRYKTRRTAEITDNSRATERVAIKVIFTL